MRAKKNKKIKDFTDKEYLNAIFDAVCALAERLTGERLRPIISEKTKFSHTLGRRPFKWQKIPKTGEKHEICRWD